MVLDPGGASLAAGVAFAEPVSRTPAYALGHNFALIRHGTTETVGVNRVLPSERQLLRSGDSDQHFELDPHRSVRSLRACIEAQQAGTRMVCGRGHERVVDRATEQAS